MCDTDTDLDLEFAASQDERGPGEAPVDGKYAGVAWGLAGTGIDSGLDASPDIDSDVQAARSR